MAKATSTVVIPAPRTSGERTFTGSVVVAVDRSPAGYRAFEWAARHALLLGTDLQVYGLPIDDTVQRVLRRLPMVTAHFRRGDDSPVWTLIDAALLVVGGLVRPVVSHARCDVVVVRGRPEGIRGEHRWITVAVGGQDDGPVLAKAISMCRARVSRLRVLHLGETWCCSAMDDARAYLRRAAPDLRADFVTDNREPREAFAGFPSDVLVLGRGHETVGPVTRAAVRHAPCPVLVATSACG